MGDAGRESLMDWDCSNEMEKMGWVGKVELRCEDDRCIDMKQVVVVYVHGIRDH
jgi:hypothetical protein